VAVVNYCIYIEREYVYIEREISSVYIYIYIYIYTLGADCTRLALQEFNDKEKRKTLFVDFWLQGEILTEMSLAHTRRLIQRKMAAVVYRPFTEADLLKKHEASYVKILMDDAIKRKRVSKDKLAPTDPLRTRSPICFIGSNPCFYSSTSFYSRTCPNHAVKNKTLLLFTS